MFQQTNVVYCVDTSAWTGMKRGYPFKSFPSLWNKLETLVTSVRLISPHEVYGELEKQEDELFKWVRQRKQLLKKLDEEQLAIVPEILINFPKLINSQSETPVADPFVVALARLETRNQKMLGGECIVVSQEKPGNIYKPKIPDVCSFYGIKHFSIVDLIVHEGWTF